MVIFHKRDSYAHKREYRMALDTGEPGTGPLILDVGDLGTKANRVDISHTSLAFRIETGGAVKRCGGEVRLANQRLN